MAKNEVTASNYTLQMKTYNESSTPESENNSPLSEGPADELKLSSDVNLTLTEYKGSPRAKDSAVADQGRIILDENTHYADLGFSFPRWKKWLILSVIFTVQTSMNFNAAIYGNAVAGLQERFGISSEYALAGQGVFLISYAFGCELWAPFSEDFGRWPIMQLSLFLVNVWQIPCALAPNFKTVVAFRSLGGFSSAGGSVTLGMIADLFEADDQQFAVLFVVLSSVGGSVVGPIVGGFVESYLEYQWVFWLQLIFGAVAQSLHWWLVPETRATAMLDKKAKKMRKENPEKYSNYYGPNEVKEHRLSLRELVKIWLRPFTFFVTEPIVLCLSLLSGFSDALIFTFLQSYAPVYQLWGFNAWQIGLAFISIAVGYILAYFSFYPDILAQKKLRRTKGSENVSPERRLLAGAFEVPLLAIGLFGFAFVSYGPSELRGRNTWIAPMLFSGIIGIANFAIYYATIDYMVASYGPYSASATGGNGFSRDLLAGISAFYAMPLYENIGQPYNLIYASLVLACIAAVVLVPYYIFYWKGQWFREKSKFAESLKKKSKERNNQSANALQEA